LNVAATPPAESPSANASPSRRTVRGSRENDRDAMNDRDDAGTSTTGAKLMSTPSARSDRPVASPSARATRTVLICGAPRNGGADRSRLTIPPSWSIAISGSATPPARAARRNRRTSART
jgi:hypothetical protein